MNSLGVQGNKELVGNLIILLAKKCAPLYHTKLIKLLYLIDEEAIRERGIPITWLDYKVWQYGPVDPAVFYIRNFSEYISSETTTSIDGNAATTIISPKKEFDDDEFSEYDLEIIEKTLVKYQNKTANELVNITHKVGSPWDLTKKENDLDFSIANISDVSIDMSRIVKNDPVKYANYKEAYEGMSFMSVLKSK
ncbi:Panacea domain-containing protein [Bacteroides thetaiotaomicron]|mgnify:CR=1 FL=1|nr:Panacea domain-containing protein [Bacteroides thetaiotaomicron]MCA6026960.1 SocA family protein [Bacteroides thetaiotaomicron]MCE9152871.1 SocA family protein [Bacteroides thetaiotaomicron]QUT38481.1 Protein of unknown function (DUF4065) [Bacteroides thetaiotaomicron]